MKAAGRFYGVGVGTITGPCDPRIMAPWARTRTVAAWEATSVIATPRLNSLCSERVSAEGWLRDL
jgi:hypothetical protein